MHSTFLSLNEEKQKKIINAAMKEFARKGYKNASTNEIVLGADISKGSLFHYFGSKKELAEYLIQHSLDVFAEKIMKNMDDMSDDIIERWRDVSLLKLNLISEYPLIFEFMLRIVNEDAVDIQTYTKDSQGKFIRNFKQKLYMGIDYSKFKEDVDVERAVKLIYWGLEGYAKEIQAQTSTGRIPENLLERSLQESNVYLDIFKQAFYKAKERSV